MELTILGMNGPFPAAGSATSGYLVTAGKACIGLDLGSGTLGRLTALTAPEDLTALFFSHWHYDHACDLLPLIFRLAAVQKKLTVYGPADPGSLVYQAAKDCPWIDLHEVCDGDSLSLDGVNITVYAARHPVPAVMLRLEHEGKVLCYTGDTNTQENLTTFAGGATLLLADGLFPESVWSEDKPHLSAARCAQLAKDAQVERLVITHLSPLIAPDELLKEARAIHIDARLAACGDRFEL